jgi:tetratricopeptide (TPR) repeat protein
MDRETTIVRELREAMRLFDDGSVREAGAIWDRYAAKRESAVQPHRLDWARARARWTLGQLDEAVAILAELDVEDVPFDVRANALTARALVLDRQGQRPEVVAACRRAMAYLDENPQYNDGLTAPLRKRAGNVLKAPQTAKPMPSFPALQGIPN